MSAPAVTSFRGPPPPPGYAGDGADRAAGAGRSTPGAAPPPGPLTPLLGPVAARVLATLALVAFGSIHWMMMVEPAAAGRAGATLGLCAAVCGLLVLAGRVRGWARAGLLLVTVAGGLVLALLAGGVPAEWLKPSEWGTFGAVVNGGTTALPGARIPYRGLDDQLRLVIPLGGTVLALVGTLLACWPRRSLGTDGAGRVRLGFPLPALIALVTLYAVPAVSLILDAEFLRGAVLAGLVVTWLRLDRLRRREAPAALVVLGAAAVLALMVAPALDKPDPWFDYENWAENAAGAKSTTFTWDHDYGALRWPRDGRELLRIRSKQRAYWKADDLDVFDGREWVRDQAAFGRNHSGVLYSGIDPRRYARWSFDLRVSVRGLRTTTLPMAGSASLVDLPGRDAQQIRPGIWTVGRPVRRGDAYRAQVYLPQPSVPDLRGAGNDFSVELIPYTGVETTSATGPGAGRPVRLWSDDFYGSDMVMPDYGSRPGGDVLAESPLRRIYALSQRLREGSPTPYTYVRAVERYLADGFTYSEAPPAASRTLDGFLFESKQGFCQHYSGAMALLLRLAGIPARVATGFAPGSYDKKNKEYVVRDLDAHSWVEAFFPHIGWVTFDPTPAAAPPRSQALAGAPTAARGDIRDIGTTQTLTPTAIDQPARVPWGLIALAVAATGLAGLTVRRLWVWHRRPRGLEVSELERALRSAGQPVPPGLTLTALEARFRSQPSVAGYVAALRAQRYTPAGQGPTPAQRRGLRRALARGRGPLTRVRTWLALPPRIGRHRRAP